jgi:aminopeptidase N
MLRYPIVLFYSKIIFMKQLFVLAGIIITALNSFSQNAVIDVLHYQHRLTLNDTTDVINATAVIKFTLTQPASEIVLDLIAEQKGKGMKVSAVTGQNKPLAFSQQAEKLNIRFGTVLQNKQAYVVTIQYAGIPADGLIISKNKFGNRTIFADNWPNRARYWLPCVDNPLDKATVEFIVIAPAHYQVIANGVQVEETNLNAAQKLTRYIEAVPIATKVMVIGLADFAVSTSGQVNCIPVYSWVYPQDKEKGNYDYAVAQNILQYFIKNVGPYSYEKLANVQSTTRFGGMENAGAIFYGETTVKGDGSNEALLAHEIAHQWFGNAAGEKSFEHLWLSEGFATYFTNLYIENKYGQDSFINRLKEERAQVIAYALKTNAPVINPTTNLFSLLNAFSYQKGSWVLHMLRRKLGNNIFWKSIQTYYSRYQNSNANTDDLRKVFEEISGTNLELFFKQWLYVKEHPVLRVHWQYDAAKKIVAVTITQTQNSLLEFPLVINFENGEEQIKKSVQVKNKVTSVNIPMQIKPVKMIIDPDTDLLFEQ